MKKIFTYMTLMAAVVLTACSDDDIAKSSSVTDSLDKYSVLGTMASVAVFEEGTGDNDAVISKSQLYYDRVNNQLKFNWTKPESTDPEYDAKVDHIGIFAQAETEVAKKIQMDFKLDPDEDVQEQGSTVTGAFIYSDQDVNPITGDKLYYTYSPFITKTEETGDFTYEAVPVSYSGQVQKANEQMGYYFNGTPGALASFLESEKAATEHLSKFDYMVSDATATAGSHVHFNYSHVASIVRFYMICPSEADHNIFYDSLQVYNSQANFTVDATMNLEEKTLTPTKTSHVMTLGFHPAIDMTCNNKHDSSDPDEQKISYYWKEDGSRGYIMAYMMVAPINLKNLTEQSTLYLIGRKASYYATKEDYNTAKGYGPSAPGYIATDEAYAALPKIQKMKIYENLEEYNAAHDPNISQDDFDKLTASDKMKDYARKVYKKSNMSKLNFQAGKHHQWSVSDAGAGDPITFDEITIQQWAEGPGFTNEDGTGTEDW